MRKLGVGLIGCGSFGQRLARTLNGLKMAHIVTVSDTDRAKAEAFGGELGVHAYVSYEPLFAREEVEAVLIATPHSTHKPIAVDAAKARKHIFCEKPMAIDVEECYQMIEAADQHGIKLMVGQVQRLYPLYAKVRGIIDSQILGRPVAMNVMALAHKIREGWWSRRSLSGGMLHSPAVHDVDFMRCICGEATEVYAVAAHQVQRNLDYCDTIFVTIRYQNGAIGALQASYSSPVPAHNGNIICDQGNLFYDPSRGLIEYGRWDGERIKIEVRDHGVEDGVRCELQSFVEWVLYDRPPILIAEDGLRVVEIIEASYRSIEYRRIVTLPLARSTTDVS